MLDMKRRVVGGCIKRKIRHIIMFKLHLHIKSLRRECQHTVICEHRVSNVIGIIRLGSITRSKPRRRRFCTTAFDGNNKRLRSRNPLLFQTNTELGI